MYNCTLLSAYTLPHQDNCNSLLAGCPQYLIDRLQVVQSATARLTCKTKQSLHWLPFRARIQDNICTLCLSVITGTGPQYLSEPLHLYTPSRDVRFSIYIHVIAKFVGLAFGQGSLFTCWSLNLKWPSTVSAILTLRLSDRLWKLTSFNNISNLLLLLSDVLFSVLLSYRVLMCVCVCVLIPLVNNFLM